MGGHSIFKVPVDKKKLYVTYSYLRVVFDSFYRLNKNCLIEALNKIRLPSINLNLPLLCKEMYQ